MKNFIERAKLGIWSHTETEEKKCTNKLNCFTNNMDIKNAWFNVEFEVKYAVFLIIFSSGSGCGSF